MTTTVNVHTHPDANQLLAASDFLNRENYEAALELSVHAMQIAEQNGDYRCFANALAQQAWLNVRLNRHEAAMLGASEALQLARAHQFTDAEVRAVGAIAFIFRRCGLKEEAARLFKHALDLAETQPDGAMLGLAINCDVMSRFDLGERAGLVEALERALSVIPVDDVHVLDHALVLNNVATILQTQKQFNSALVYARRSLNLSRSAKATRQTAATLNTISHIYFASGDHDMALEYARRARRNINPSDLDLNRVNFEMLIARIHAARGSDREAVAAWENAYTLAIQGDMLHFAIESLTQIRDFYEKQGDQANVINAYRRLNDEVIQRQHQNAKLRLSVIAMVFGQNKVRLQEQVQLAQQKYDILHRLSHEFRTPLTVIQSSAEMVGEYGEKMSLERRQKHLKNITGQVRSMTAMLQNITALLHEPESAIGEVDKPVTLITMAYTIIARLDSAGVESERVRMTVQPNAAPVRVKIDAVEAIAFHLLHNALRYSTESVAFDIYTYAGALMLQITDSGIGIPEDEHRAVFEPLVRGSNQQQPTGAGLGLAIVAKQIARLRGTIDLVSDTGQGTTVTVRIPM